MPLAYAEEEKCGLTFKQIDYKTKIQTKEIVSQFLSLNFRKF